MTTIGRVINATLEVYGLSKAGLARRMGIEERKFYNQTSYLNDHMGYMAITRLLDLFIDDPSMDIGLVIDACRKKEYKPTEIMDCQHTEEYNKLREVRIKEIQKDIDAANRAWINSAATAFQDMLTKVFCTAYGPLSACKTYSAEHEGEQSSAPEDCVKFLFEQFLIDMMQHYLSYSDRVED